jgi:hypothetical protein
VTEPDELERALAPIRRTLGGERVKELRAEGRGMTLEQAVAYALEDRAAR